MLRDRRNTLAREEPHQRSWTSCKHGPSYRASTMTACWFMSGSGSAADPRMPLIGVPGREVPRAGLLAGHDG